MEIPQKVDVAVVGAGITGLSTAYNLARRGLKVIVLERGFVGGGDSTRNASRFRVHFASVENTRYAIEAVKELHRVSSQLPWNPMLRKGGYLWLFRDRKTLEAYERLNDTIWRPLGVSLRFMDQVELKERYGYINAGLYAGAALGAEDGELHHDYLIYGYLFALRKMGVLVIDNARVIRIRVSGGIVNGVDSTRASITADNVVVAAGSWSNELLEPLGVRLPITVVRKEIGVTAPIRHLIEPSLIIDTASGMYIGQTLRGELIGSVELPEEPGMKPLNNTLRWLRAWSRALSETMPMASRIPIIRVWSGYYDMTPDNSHIVGRSDSWPRGLYVALGFSGHGLMFGPLTGRLLAEYIASGRVNPLMEPYMPDRFSKGRLISETLVV